MGDVVKRILIIGGYGGFGARVAQLLARRGHEVLVGGRNSAKARAFCDAHPDLTMRPCVVDRGDVAPVLAAETPWLVVDAAGPFQDAAYDVPRACIAARCHYLDLADGRAFVGSIHDLDEAAKAAGVAIISGASSLPALSTAVVDRLSAGMDRVSEIDMALAASNRASGGTSVTKAILSYVGKPIRLWRGQTESESYGWQDMGTVSFAVPGKAVLRRRVALCDVPDLALMPNLYPGRPAVRFRAGTEIAVQTLALWWLSWLVRWGWLRSLTGLSGIGVALQKLFGRVGGDRSALRIDVRGWVGEQAIARHWTLLAEEGDGPWIPALAVPLLVDRLVETVTPGARSAARLLPLEDFERAFADFAITMAAGEDRPAPLYARIMGADYDALAPEVRALHRVNGDLGAHGQAKVGRGTSLGARLIGWIMGFPPAKDDVPVHVWMHERGGTETWWRDFGGRRFCSHLSQRGDMVVERFGPIRFAMKLERTQEGLAMPFRRWWIGPVPMPRFLLPRGVAREFVEDGRFHFDVPITLPLIGPVVHYRGWLIPGASRVVPAPASAVHWPTAA